MAVKVKEYDKVSDLLKAALRRMSGKDQWLQGELGYVDGAVCARGSISAVIGFTSEYNDASLDDPANDGPVAQAAAMLVDKVSKDLYGTWVASVNDGETGIKYDDYGYVVDDSGEAPATSKRKVFKVFRTAIEQAKAQGN